MKAPYQRATDWSELFECIRAQQPKTVIFDVEPLVAHWNTDEQALRRGVARVLDEGLAAAGAETVVFAMNSWRRPAVMPDGRGVRVRYLHAAGKPFRVAPYRTLPRPGVIVGDQVAVDGVLAWRLGYSFIHYCPDLAAVPVGPRIVMYLNRPLRRLLFVQRP